MKVNNYEIKPYANLRGANLQGADLRGANLRGANLRGANLRGANLRYADLQGADLQGADLRGANLRGANLRGANLRYANPQDADLQGADLRGANLRGANLRYANPQGADLQGADLQGANLQGANLYGADLQGAKNIPACTISRLQVLPDEGDVVGWKKCLKGVIVKLLIKGDTPRSSATSRKCRAKYVTVLEVYGGTEGVSSHDYKTVYRKGETVHCDKWDEDRWNECAGGIHFFITRQEAEDY